MNITRKAKIANLIKKLETILAEEEEYFEKIPESLEDSEKFYASENAIEYLQEAIGNLQNITEEE